MIDTMAFTSQKISRVKRLRYLGCLSTLLWPMSGEVLCEIPVSERIAHHLKTVLNGKIPPFTELCWECVEFYDS